MRQQKPNTLLNQTLEIDDDRIDWAKKMLKKKRPEEDNDVDEVLEAELPEITLDAKPRSKKGKQKKPRPLVLDETSGRVFVKRQRKENRNQYEEWSDDYD